MTDLGCTPRSMHSTRPVQGHSCNTSAILQSRQLRRPKQCAQRQPQSQAHIRRADGHCCCSLAESRTEVSKLGSMPYNDCVWSQRALYCLQAPSAPAEEPLKEPINQDLDVSHAVVDASYRRVKLLHVCQRMNCTCMFYRTTCSQGKLTSNDLSTPSVAACSIYRVDAMLNAC